MADNTLTLREQVEQSLAGITCVETNIVENEDGSLTVTVTHKPENGEGVGTEGGEGTQDGTETAPVAPEGEGSGTEGGEGGDGGPKDE